ncbi:MAG: ABC transporter permease subunit [Dehalococcoidia bacterium]|nr:ABC transporter permease subunit [Dehalococcoidia bacterium]
MAVEITGIAPSPAGRLTQLNGIYRKLRRLPIIPVVILTVVVLSGLTAPLISPHDPEKGNLQERHIPPFWYSPEYGIKTVVDRVTIDGRLTQIDLRKAKKVDPEAELGDKLEILTKPGGSARYILGSDSLGRDVLSRIIYGARISVIVAVVTLGIGGTFGVVVGLAAGWYGGWVDEVLMRLVDIKLSIPLILIALVLVITLGQSFGVILTVLAIFIWPRFARQVRGEVLQLKHSDYVALAKISGASTARIMFIHIFPGTINTLIVVATLQVGIVILLESTLSFLGAGVPPPTPAWGSMIAEGRDKLAGGIWWSSTFPGLAIMTTVVALNLLGDWLRDTLDPRLRQME